MTFSVGTEGSYGYCTGFPGARQAFTRSAELVRAGELFFRPLKHWLKICRWEKQMIGRMEEDTASIWTPRTASTLT